MKKYAFKVTPRCFWCGRDKKETVIVKNLKDGRGNLKSTWINGDYEPCDICKIKMDRGVTVVEAGEAPMVEKQIRYHGFYPTGNWLVMTDNGIRKFCGEEDAEQAIDRRIVFVTHELYNDMVYAIKHTLQRRKTEE